MARIRTVKPELFRHEELYELELETGLPIRLSFIALFTCCDREGRFKWRPRQLKLDCLPYDDVDFSRVLDALLTRGFIVKYENGSDVYGCIPTFLQHQVINNRERDSEIPCYSECGYQAIENNGLSTRHPRVIHASSTPLEKDKGELELELEGKGKEWKENNGDKSPDRFEEFWEVFADKRGKDGALKVWRRRKLNNIADEVIDGAKKYAANRGPDKKYWKQAQGWLNDGRWKDEVPDSNSQFSGMNYGEGIQDL